MPIIRKWNPEKLLKLYKLKRENNKGWEDISKELGFSVGALKRVFDRTQWEEFLKNPSFYESSVHKKWSHDEMVQLDAYLQSGKSYGFIAEKLNRTIISVERQSQVTDWKAWRELSKIEMDKQKQAHEQKDIDKQNNNDKPKEEDDLLQRLTLALLTVIRYDYNRLNTINEKEFLKKINLDKDKLVVKFSDLKKIAEEELEKLGFKNPETIEFGQGCYVIVGDSHGKHTKSSMFELIHNVNEYLKPDKIIHIGHILDDDNDISYNWGRFKNLLILAKIEELKIIQEQRNKFEFNYDIVRENINLGDLIVLNQDIINDYAKTSISNLKTDIFDERAIVNCHRLEFSTRCYNSNFSYIASPGSICEKHIIRTIKQMDFTDGRVVKQAFWEGFSKYRKMRHNNKFWEMGMLIVNVDKYGNNTIVPCPIKISSKGFMISYFDKMISSKGVFEPDNKIFVNGDMHCDQHDINVLDVQEQICKDYKPKITVNVGDAHNYSSLNHHVMDRGGIIMDKKILDEAAETHYVLKRTSSWAKDNYLICGNHERFANDFSEKYPQFGEFLKFAFLCGLGSLGYKLIELKDVLKIGSAKFIHGEIKMYGQNGNKLEKASRTFGRDVFIGHIHCPEIRLGCYSLGLSGKLDQHYNEPNASKWMHGFGLCNQYKGQSWPTTIAIINNTCIIGNKTYKPSNVNSWKLTKYVANINYSFS